MVQINETVYSSVFVNYQSGLLGCGFRIPISMAFKTIPTVLSDPTRFSSLSPFCSESSYVCLNSDFSESVAHVHAISVQAQSYLYDSFPKEFNPKSYSRHTLLFIKRKWI